LRGEREESNYLEFGEGKMKKNILMSTVVCLFISGFSFADSFGTGGNLFDIDFVTISGSTNPTSGYGIVNNDYRMGKFEITNSQWNAFINSYATPTGNPFTAYNLNAYFTGTNVPTNRVSWYEAAQFVNYLNTSTGNQAAYKFTGDQGTSNYTLGVWNISDAGYNSSNPFRNSNAHYFMPTEDEWVKAAYWNGTGLQAYATTSNSTPVAGVDGNFNGVVGQPWDVGSGSEELNGTFDMMGNVWEWMENPYYNGDYVFDCDRGVRSGAYNYSRSFLSSFRLYGPSDEHRNTGFRVASVPEPTALSLLALGAILAGRRRRI
jgi:hypothetical protein